MFNGLDIWGFIGDDSGRTTAAVIDGLVHWAVFILGLIIARDLVARADLSKYFATVTTGVRFFATLVLGWLIWAPISFAVNQVTVVFRWYEGGSGWIYGMTLIEGIVLVGVFAALYMAVQGSDS
jgi:hypothetical protein